MDLRVISRNEPPPGTKIDGFVVGIEIERPDPKGIRVYLPDGNVYDLGVKQITPVRVGDAQYVPVES